MQHVGSEKKMTPVSCFSKPATGFKSLVHLVQTMRMAVPPEWRMSCGKTITLFWGLLQILLREATRIDLISCLPGKRKCDEPKHQGKPVYYLIHETNNTSLPLLLLENQQINKKSWWGSKVERKKVAHRHQVYQEMEWSSIITTDLP